jgi:uncharacterized protein YhfF
MMEHPEVICEFALPGPIRDRLVDSVLRGEKTATSSLLAEWEHDGDPLSNVGERQTVVDSCGQPVAEIELTALDVVRLGDVGLDVALAEGEGFSGVDDWRSAHERFWEEFVLPDLPGGLISGLDDDTLVVVERFRLVSAFDR